MYFHIHRFTLLYIYLYINESLLQAASRAWKDPKRNRPSKGKNRGQGRACRDRAATSRMQEVTSQDSAEDLVSTTPTQEQSSHKDMQDDQRQQDQWAPVTLFFLCYLPPLGQCLLQVHDFGLAAAELRLQLLTCLTEERLVIRWEYVKFLRKRRTEWNIFGITV